MMKEKYKNLMSKLLTQFSASNADPISIRALFGGTGICYNGIMFAWIHDDQFYLRGHFDYLSMFIDLQMEPLVLDIGVTAKLLQYYKVTNALWNDEKKLIKTIQMVIEYSYRDKVSQRQVKESRIKDLPNMTLSLERALYKVGIINIESFKKHGPYDSYFKLKQGNKNISNNILFILYSALLRVHVATLSEEEKLRLKKEYKRFIITRRDSNELGT